MLPAVELRSNARILRSSFLPSNSNGWSYALKMFVSVFAILIVLAEDAPARAQNAHRLALVHNPLIGRVLNTNCHSDVCYWKTLREQFLLLKGGKGELHEAIIGEASSWHKGSRYPRVAPKTLKFSNTRHFAFCSKLTPATIYQMRDEEKWLANMLAPGHDDGVRGFNLSEYVLYFAICHGIALANGYESIARGKQLGYRVGAERVGQEELDAIEDILKK